MIGRLRGRLLEREPSALVVEAGGVGYEVRVPLTTFTRLQDGEVDLFIHTDVREDAIVLFGFLSREERETFRRLTTVQGVGPMTALAVLSGMELPELLTAIARGDTRRMEAVPRIGKKTAQRICLELKERIGDLWPASASEAREPAPSPDLADAVAALQNLGYKTQLAQKALETARARAPEGTLEDWIRLALKSLAP
ncbi:MAG: Holliday junction branch migration protein RuvA [Acidobacteriota bacterium]